MTMSRSDAVWRRSLTGLAVAALAVRLIHLGELRDTPFFTVPIGDAKEYDAWAQEIVGGHWLGTEVFYQTPLYPYLLGVIFAVAGHHLLAVRVFQAVLGALSCVALALAGRRFFDERVGLISGALLAVYPPAVFFDGLIQKASLDLFFMTVLLALLGSYQLRPDLKYLMAAGLTLGLFSLNRENARILYPIFGLWLLLTAPDQPLRRRAGRVALLTASILLVLVPVGLRNYAVGGEFLLSTSQFGPNFYIGNHKGAPGSYEALVPGRGNAAREHGDARRLAEAAVGRTLSEGEISDYWLHRALAYIGEEPFDWLRLTGRKLLLTFGAHEIVDTESLEVYAQQSHVLRMFAWIHFGVLLPIAVFGVWLTRANGRRLAILYAMGVATAVAVAVFFVVARYRYPMVPIVLLFAASALSRFPELVRQPAARWWPGAAAAILVAFVVNQSAKAEDDDTYLNLGAELIRLDRPAEALPLLEKAIAASPEYAAPYLNLAIALQRTGETSKAIDMFTRALRLSPDYFEAHDGLALTLQEAGRSAEAMEHFREALRLRPESAETHSNFGTALAALGQSSEAIAQYQESLRLKPGRAKVHNNLGVALHQAGRVDEAIPHYLAALAADPVYAEAHSNLALAFQAKGNGEAAVEHFREAVRLRPEVAPLHLNLGNLLMSLSRTQEAIVELSQATNLSPESLESHLSLAQAWIQAGRMSEAIVELEQSLKIARAAGADDDARKIEAAIRQCRARLPPPR